MPPSDPGTKRSLFGRPKDSAVLEEHSNQAPIKETSEAQKTKPKPKLSRLFKSAESAAEKVSAIRENRLYQTGEAFYNDNTSEIKDLGNQIGVQSSINFIEDRISTFEQSSKVLVNALDDVAKLHVVIGVAVLAFKLVLKLELTRRANSRKIIALHLLMQDTMSMLLELQTVKDPELKDSDGNSSKGRMQKLMDILAMDIKSCGNACDLYTQRLIIVKVLRAPIYESELADFSTTFATRRKDLTLALAIHTTRGVDSANSKLDQMQETLTALDTKIGMLALFRDLDSAQEKELLRYVTEQKGSREAYLKDDDSLQELAEHTNSLPAGQESLALLRAELNEDFSHALADNMVRFESKLVVQEKILNDIMIQLKSGSHDLVIDTDLQKIWKDMGWKASIDGKTFVAALYDYFSQKNQRTNSTASNEPSSQSSDEQWALPYISIQRTQPLMEAFDDDGSGFVTIYEANAFAISRPLDWSLPHWLAFWAAGWHSSVLDYHSGICSMVKDILNSLDRIIPPNRASVDAYVAHPDFKRLDKFARSLKTDQLPFSPQDKLKMLSFIVSENVRIRGKLESLGYEVDSADTVASITGPGRIERYICPLLYFVLQRHLQIIQLACEAVLHQDELSDALKSFNMIWEVARERVRNLEVVFKQHNADLSSQLEVYAFGMLRVVHDIEEKQEDLSEGTFIMSGFWRNPILEDYEHMEEGTNDGDDSNEERVSNEADSSRGDSNKDDENNDQFCDATNDLDLGILKYGPQPSSDSPFPCNHWNTRCSSCSRTPIGSRIVCLECISPDYQSQIDLCTRCITMTFTTGFSHVHGHNIMKVERFLHDQLKHSVISQAYWKRDQSRTIFRPYSNGWWDSSDEHPPLDLRCSCCNEHVDPPCWLCVSCCSTDVLICDACDATSPTVTTDDVDHDENHILIRCHPDVVTGETKSLSSMLSYEPPPHVEEGKFNISGSLEQQIRDSETAIARRLTEHEAAFDRRIAELERNFAERLTRIEDMLKLILKG